MELDSRQLERECEPEPEQETGGVAALLASLGMMEHLPACLEHDMDLGAPRWNTNQLGRVPCTILLFAY